MLQLRPGFLAKDDDAVLLIMGEGPATSTATEEK